MAKLVAGSGATNQGKVGKEEKRDRALYLSFKGLLAPIFSKHGKREVGDNLKKSGRRRKKRTCHLGWKALGDR